LLLPLLGVFQPAMTTAAHAADDVPQCRAKTAEHFRQIKLLRRGHRRLIDMNQILFRHGHKSRPSQLETSG